MEQGSEKYESQLAAYLEQIKSKESQEQVVEQVKQGVKRKGEGEQQESVSKKARLEDTHDVDSGSDSDVYEDAAGSIINISPTTHRKKLTPKSPRAKINSSVPPPPPTEPACTATPSLPPPPTATLDALPVEILERIFNQVDNISLTYISLVNKQFLYICQQLADATPEFPVIKKKYQHDAERHAFMEEFPKMFKDMKYCFVCRKYKYIEGGKVKIWKNCPKKHQMGDEPAPPGSNDKTRKIKPIPDEVNWTGDDWDVIHRSRLASHLGHRQSKQICPPCAVEMHTLHHGLDPATFIPRFVDIGNPLGGTEKDGRIPFAAKDPATRKRRIPGLKRPST
jgi:hypothetical protein